MKLSKSGVVCILSCVDKTQGGKYGHEDIQADPTLDAEISPPDKRESYHNLGSEEEGKSPAYIAKRIGCHRSTICRELERNRSKKGYCAKKAQKKAEYRVREKAEDRRKLTAAMWSHAMAKVDMGWTFEQISGRAKRDGEAIP